MIKTLHWRTSFIDTVVEGSPPASFLPPDKRVKPHDLTTTKETSSMTDKGAPRRGCDSNRVDKVLLP
jgi:hypothetical protein